MIAKKGEIFLERHTAKLSFAVSLMDDYSMGKPIGRVDVSLKGRKEQSIKNLSSYYLFLDLPEGTYTVQVRSEYYFDEDSEPINTAERDPEEPVDILLKPNPSYPFPPGATLLRGVVYDSAGKTVSDAKVRVEGRDVESKTTEQGEFVLYFRSLTEDDIMEEEGKRFVKGNGDKTLNLEVEYGGVTKTIELEAEEGETTSVTFK